jgi:type IV pilus assembly protein PilB
MTDAKTSRKFRLGEMLVAAGTITQPQLDEALARSKQSGKVLGEALVELNLIKPLDVLKVVGQQMGIPAIDLHAGLLDPAVLHRLPKEKAEYYGVIPMLMVDDRLTLAVTKPLSIFDFDDLERLVDAPIQLVLCQTESVQRAIDQLYSNGVSLDGLMNSIENAKLEVNSDDARESEQLSEISEDSPIASLVNYIIATAITEKASDIHIEPDGKIVRVRYRIDGVLREIMTQKISLHPAMVSRIKVMSKLDIAERRRPQDGRIAAKISTREVDVRVSTLPTTNGEKVVMRVLDSANLVFDLEQLGFRPDLSAKFRRMLARPHGLILVTGPTGSGKTTTLYSALNQLRSPEKNLVTIEDPVEYQLPMVNQVQVNAQIDLTFASILRSVLRQDPNVVMVGEIRDSETAKTAVEASLTGHLVLSTLHTNDAVGSISRLTNIGVEPFLLGSALVGVIAQRLARKICPNCKTEFQPTVELKERLYLKDDSKRYFKGAGCKSCFNSGYRGRLGLYELFEITPDVRAKLEEGADTTALMALRRTAKETTLFQEGLLAAEAGHISLEEVLRVAWAPGEKQA